MQRDRGFTVKLKMCNYKVFLSRLCILVTLIGCVVFAYTSSMTSTHSDKENIGGTISSELVVNEKGLIRSRARTVDRGDTDSNSTFQIESPIGKNFALNKVLNSIHIVQMQKRKKQLQERKTSYYPIKYGNISVYFSAAYLDMRYNQTVIRILGLKPRNASIPLACKFNERGNATTSISEMVIYDEFPENTPIVATLWTCDSPDINVQQVQVYPVSASPHIGANLPVSKAANSSIHRQQYEDITVALCIKPVHGNIDPHRLIEWIEILRIAGVQYLSFYVGNVQNPEVLQRVFKLYEKEAILEWVTFDLIQSIMNELKTKNKLTDFLKFSIFEQGSIVSLNDCVYKMAQHFSHVLVIDIDELFLPPHGETIQMVLTRASIDDSFYYNVSGYIFSTAWYFKSWNSSESVIGSEVLNPSDKMFYFTSHQRRSKVLDLQPKSIISAQTILAINGHGSMISHPSSGRKLNFYLRDYEKYGYVHHFRNTCIEKFYNKDCIELSKHVEIDSVLPLYKKLLLHNDKINSFV